MNETEKQVTEALEYVDAQIAELLEEEARLNKLLETENTLTNTVKLRIVEVTLLAFEDLGNDLSAL